MRRISVTTESWPIAGHFTIARGAKAEAHVVIVDIVQNGMTGRGECVPYPRYGETVEGVVAAIADQTPSIERGMDRRALTQAMPAGAARNAIDCALIDLEAKSTGRTASDILGVPAPVPVLTAYTISLGTPDKMAAATARAADRPLLKIKLGGDGDVKRIAAVRAAAPNSRLIVDANESWSPDNFTTLIKVCATARVELIEQPLPADLDGALRDLPRPVPVCADESVHGLASLDAVAGAYDAINIKLDKTGGLTEAVLMVREARQRGLTIMVGCMVATSLSMAPAMCIAGLADYVDLDGPLLLARDRDPGLAFDGSMIHPPTPDLWG
jgi:L-Ala-D/L-Glu epimerase / N-acetyl-D-glutamate racemase